jgi:hypothetical protein
VTLGGAGPSILHTGIAYRHGVSLRRVRQAGDPERVSAREQPVSIRGAYDHGDSLRRARRAGDPFRASARHERRTAHTIHGDSLPYAAAHLSIPKTDRRRHARPDDLR